MKHDKTLHDLGFAADPKPVPIKKKESKKNNREKPPIKPPNATNLERLQEYFYNVQRHPSPDAPADTEISSGHNDTINKGEEGFETWVGKWKEGYPR